jgi:hypothetical protein
MGFDPATASLGLGVLGLGAQVFGGLKQGSAQAASANYQAQVARNNAVIAEQNAQYAIKAGAQEATTQGMKNRAVMGKIMAAQAASGVDVNTGSAVDVQRSQRETGLLDTMTIDHNALLKAYGYRAAGTSFQGQATLDEAEGRQARTGSQIGAAGTLLGGASSLGFKWNSATASGRDAGATPDDELVTGQIRGQ